MNKLSEMFFVLSLRLNDMLHVKGHETARPALLISSARDEEGKTFIARSIAQHMAAVSSGKVLLVDGNLQRPALHSIYGFENTGGFSDCLAGANLATVPLHATAQPELKIMTIGQQLEPVLLFKPQSYLTFLEYFRRQFDLIVIDGGVLVSCGCLPRLSDGIIMVVDSSKTRREVVQGVIAQANIERSRYLGAVLNKRMQYIPDFFYRRF